MDLRKKFIYLFFSLNLLLIGKGLGQEHSVARKWNEALLKAIKVDFARPTVHARNLYHTSLAMYDAWAVYDDTASTVFLNHTLGSFYCPFNGINKPKDVKSAQEEAISYAAFRILEHRFANSPGAKISLPVFQNLLIELGFDPNNTSVDYSDGSPAALGNYISSKIIEFGLEDGSNEANSYKNTFYNSVNPVLVPFQPGNLSIQDPNRWQSIALKVFVDQSGIPVPDGAATFLSAEWGKVVPFAMKKEDLSIKEKESNAYFVYHDPGPPPYFDPSNTENGTKEYIWNFLLVAIWGSHLDPADNVMIDISPRSNGNIQKLPKTFEEYQSFYNLFEGGDNSKGYEINPKTGNPYTPQYVKRGDFARVLAEFWADGPNSETPPGHWFTILNYVNDHPHFKKRFGGKGPIMEDLEWDIKSYLSLSGGLHDAAVTAWGIKGYYDYIRPISAIRYLASLGQSDSNFPNYHPAGLPLYDGFVEQVKEGDPLQGTQKENIGKIKLYTWKGPEYITDPKTEIAEVGWILAENWWPYQRPTFVTPPFAGYVSGHSTFSRSAAEILTRLTGDEYFPGGMSDFKAKKNDYLVFEVGPSEEITLQWAKYVDASNQCSLSRIWGGIHPPADDITGRILGEKIGVEAFEHSLLYFNGTIKPENDPTNQMANMVYPNPIAQNGTLKIINTTGESNGSLLVVDLLGKVVSKVNLVELKRPLIEFKIGNLPEGMYSVVFKNKNKSFSKKFIVSNSN